MRVRDQMDVGWRALPLRLIGDHWARERQHGVHDDGRSCSQTYMVFEFLFFFSLSAPVLETSTLLLRVLPITPSITNQRFEHKRSR